MEALKMLLIVAACAGIALAAILLFPGEKPVPAELNITDSNTGQVFMVNATLKVNGSVEVLTSEICGYPGIGGQTERPKECQRRCQTLGTENYGIEYISIPYNETPPCMLFCVCTRAVK